jgi:DNA-binding NarL/FixJ family response regulator
VIGQQYLTSMPAVRPIAGEARIEGFSLRERGVLQGVFEGLANKEIGARLQVSEGSVKATLQQLFEKTGVRTRSQLVRMVLERYRHVV